MSSYVTIPEGADKKIGTVLINTDEHIQRIAHDSELIEFQKVLDATKLSGAESFWFDCSGLEKIYLKILFSNTTDTVNIRFGFLDYNNEVTYSDEYTISNSGVADSTYYLGVIKSEDVLGFQKVKIRLTSSPSGNVIGYIGGISDKVEVTKGYQMGDNSSSNLTYEYNQQTDTWTTKSNYPSPGRGNYTVSTLLSKAYFCCGYDGSTSIKDTDEYNPDTWTSKTDSLSPARYDLTSFSILNKLYISCGIEYGTWTRYKDTDEYNPDTWTSKTDAPSPERCELTNNLNILNKGYLVFGQYYDGGNILIKDTDEYNPDTWTSKTDGPSPARERGNGGVVTNKLYYNGGEDSTNCLSDNDEYNPDTWTSKTNIISPARKFSSNYSILNKLYTSYGDNCSNSIRDVDEYSPDTWTSKSDGLSPAIQNKRGTSI